MLVFRSQLVVYYYLFLQVDVGLDVNRNAVVVLDPQHGSYRHADSHCRICDERDFSGQYFTDIFIDG